MGLPGDSNYPYSYYEGNDFALNLAIPDIDFGTLHLYTTDCTYLPVDPVLLLSPYRVLMTSRGREQQLVGQQVGTRSCRRL
jgi:hypothetical protein